MAGQVIKRAGITAVVLVGAMMAAGPAAAAAAAPAAHTATTARGAPAAPAPSAPARAAPVRAAHQHAAQPGCSPAEQPGPPAVRPLGPGHGGRGQRDDDPAGPDGRR